MKSRSKRSGRSAKSKQPTQVERTWPPFISLGEARFLVRRTREVARDRHERALFLAVVRRAYDDVAELEALYAELPGVFRGDRESRRAFVAHLERAGKSPRFPPGRWSKSWDSDAREIEVVAPGRPPIALFKPSLLVFLAQGIQLVSDGEHMRFDAHVNALGSLWRPTYILQRLYRDAVQGSRDGKVDRLGTSLRRITLGAHGHGHGHYPDGSSLPGDSYDDGFTLPGDEDPFGSGGGGELDFPPGGDGLGDDGLFGTWPPVDFIPEHHHDFDYQLEVCIDRAFGKVSEIVDGPYTTYSSAGIQSIVPDHICEARTIEVRGTFPATQPSDTSVVVDGQVVPVVSWSSTVIVIRIGANVRSGCVGFSIFHEARTPDPVDSDAATRDIGDGISACFGYHVALPAPGEASYAAPCTGRNALWIGLPRIEDFNLLDAPSQPTPSGSPRFFVAADEPIRVHVDVRGATTVSVHLDVHGEANSRQLFENPSEHVLTFDPIGGTGRQLFEIWVVAFNSCGRSLQQIFGISQSTPSLAIVGVELIQTLQSFSVTAPSANNSIPLVTGKRTIARVYVTNASGALANVTGFLELRLLSGSTTVSTEVVLNPATPGVPAGTIVAPVAAASITRNNAAQTLNFELPPRALEGNVQVVAHAFLADFSHRSDAGWHATDASTQATFHHTRAIRIRPILVADTFRGAPAPTLGAFLATLQGVRTRYPIADDGLVVLAPISIARTADFGLAPTWEALAHDLDVQALGYDSADTIWVAVVPTDPAYAMSGYAAFRSVVLQVGFHSTMAHELGHIHGFGHSACGTTPIGLDSRLPSSTEDIGWDAPLGSAGLVPKSSPEIMGYCGSRSDPPVAMPRRWPSIAFYTNLFEQLR